MAAKQGRIRNLGNTITRNKAVVAGEAGEEWLQASPVTISQQGDQLDTEREAVVVWSWRAARAPDTSADRVLSVGKMLVRTDGKGEVN